ncbi:MAG: transporter substrate-binding domain-containing protein [Tissierellia bacterium]|nr:transporter substrate-binding domain-containing protein [Tissierellia bacterium]
MKGITKILLLLVVLSVLLVGCSPKESAPATEGETTTETEAAANEGEAKDDNTFVVGMEAAYAPFNWTQLDDSNGAVPLDGLKEFAGGYDVQVAKLIAEGLGKELVVKKIEWDGLQPSIQSNKIDAIVAGMSPSAARREVLDFTDPYYASDLVVVVKADGPFKDATSLAEFAGAKITAMLNTLHYAAIDQIEGVDKQEPIPDFSSMRAALQAGKIDGYISERPEAISASAANPAFAFNDLTDGFKMESEETTVAVGVAKGSPLVDEINEILKGITPEKQDELMKQAIADQPAAME